jgi:8-oxo-dGTP diphosphatase
LKELNLLPVVAAALIDDNARVLVQKRPPGLSMAGLWEFPGGKIERGECPEETLVRELAEELGVEVDSKVLKPVCFASEPLGDRHLLLMLYLCRRWGGDVRPLHASELRWVTMSELALLEMPPADQPLIPALARVLHSD